MGINDNQWILWKSISLNTLKDTYENMYLKSTWNQLFANLLIYITIS